MPTELIATTIPTTQDVDMPPTDLLETDEQPLETPLHRATINLLIEQLEIHLAGRKDFYVGGNMFIYYSAQQAMDRDFKGPDFFFVRGVDHDRYRPVWAVWKENGHYPDVIIELTSDSTAEADFTTKKDLYEQTFRTQEYFCFDPVTHTLYGWRLESGRYVPLIEDEHGRMPCDVLGLRVGPWSGTYLEREARWLRFFTPEGIVVPLLAELEHMRAEHQRRRAEIEKQRADTEKQRADTEKQRADTEKQRAETSEAQLERLRQELALLKQENTP